MEVEPFDAPETKPYEDLPELVALKNLFHAYGTDDIKLFDKILQQNRENIVNDPLIKGYVVGKYYLLSRVYFQAKKAKIV